MLHFNDKRFAQKCQTKVWKLRDHRICVWGKTTYLIDFRSDTESSFITLLGRNTELDICNDPSRAVSCSSIKANLDSLRAREDLRFPDGSCMSFVTSHDDGENEISLLPFFEVSSCFSPTAWICHLHLWIRWGCYNQCLPRFSRVWYRRWASLRRG